MSAKYPGGFITKNYVAPTPAAAPGIWTLDQQLQAQKTGTWPFGGPFNYIEDVFSTYLYTGDGSSAQNINNGIDLAGKGGMVWVKGRSDATTNVLVDTNRFVSSSNIQCLFSNSTAAASASANEFGSFNSNGFSIPYNTTAGWTNFGTRTFASWTFRKQPKFFDVVTYTGNGGSQNISHSLGSQPGMVIVKRTDASEAWGVAARLDSTTYATGLSLNAPDAALYAVPAYNTFFTSTYFDAFRVINAAGDRNTAGATYVAYLFAHNAGGFGATGTDNVISCGSFTTDGSGNATVSLGYEPQWLMVKRSDTTQNWYMWDSMRGFNVSQSGEALSPNTSGASSAFQVPVPTATGFNWVGGQASATYIYIAIRRGPMKVPTDGTKVFAPVAYSTSSTSVVNSGFPTDMAIAYYRTASGNSGATSDRLRGSNVTLFTPSTGAEVAIAGWSNYNTSMSGVEVTAGSSWANGSNFIWWNFRRAPGFFDEVCYTGTGVATTVAHNLTVAPELMIIKSRSYAGNAWLVYSASLGPSNVVELDSSSAAGGNSNLNNTNPTASVFSIGSFTQTNASGYTYVAYLFATCPGVSKVFSFTGNGTTQTINCGFAGGARFVLLKASSATGGWYVYDTARGMTVLTDPYLQLNTTAAEVATLGSVTTVTTGFAVNEAITTGVNTNGVTYIGLAIA